MPFRFYSTGRICSLVSLLIPLLASAQLTWNSDVVVFGTEQEERQPQIVTISPTLFRAFCVRDDAALSTRRSLNFGDGWAAFSDRSYQAALQLLAVVADNNYSYALTAAPVQISRISHESESWPDEQPITLDIGASTLVTAHMVTDADFAPDDAYLHLFALLRANDGGVVLRYARSEDSGISFGAWQTVDSLLSIEDSSAAISSTVTWHGDAERLWVAVNVDRPGTTGEQIQLYSSDDLGETWSLPLTPDSSSYAQFSPTLGARDTTIVLAYARRTSASLARDVFLTYSPDNGLSWPEPLPLTDHVFDDMYPRVVVTEFTIGLTYTRAQVDQSYGTLYHRWAELHEPWNWSEAEFAVSPQSGVRLSDRVSVCPDRNFCAAVWTGLIGGTDGDIFFDSQWRGLATQPHGEPRSSASMRETSAGTFEFELPSGRPQALRVFDLLGRQVLTGDIGPGQSVWQVPHGLPTGSYWLTVAQSPPLRFTVVR